jgi:hypothetical protein
VAQSVGIDLSLDAGGAGGETERAPECLLTGPAPLRSGVSQRGLAVGQPQAAKLDENWLRQWNAALLIAFADDPQHSLGVINIADLNLRRLADAQATGIHELKTGPVDRIAHRSQDGADLGIGEHNREALLPRCANAFFLGEQRPIAVERPRIKKADPAVIGFEGTTRDTALISQMEEIGANLLVSTSGERM